MPPPTFTAAALRAALCLSLSAGAAAASAQTSAAPRSSTAAPEVYKVIAQGPQHRVLNVVLEPGQRTPPHSHPPATAVYFVTACSLKIAEFGSETDARPAAGTAIFMGVVYSHSVLNTSKSPCRMVYFEPK